MTTSEFAGATPQLVVSDAAGAIAFYQAAFGADELVRNPGPDGRIMHSELLIFGGRVLVADDFAEDPADAPTRLGGTTVRLHLSVPNADEVYARAIAAGAESITEPADMFWGDRYAMVRDPYGHLWSIGATSEDLSVAELRSRAETWSSEQ